MQLFSYYLLKKQNLTRSIRKFTLIELLVVIGIIAILSALLWRRCRLRNKIHTGCPDLEPYTYYAGIESTWFKPPK